MKIFLENLKNNFDFFLRQKIKVSRKNYSEENESKEGLFCDENIIKKENELIEKFDLIQLKLNSTRRNYLDNLYTIDLLDRYLELKYQDKLSVLDIGSKNWFYVKGEYFFFKKNCEKLNIIGIEIDANRLYSNLYNREEVANFYIKNLDGAKYIHGDFLKHNQKYDFIIWVLPFVVKEPLLKWGLPVNYFKPEEMLLHAYDLLNENGCIFIINQGEVEYNIQKKLCEKLNISYVDIGEVKSDFLDYKYPRYSILIKK